MQEFRRQRGYPLTALFVLVGICAILSALLGPAIHVVATQRVDLSFFFRAAMGSAICIGIQGLFVGLFHHNRGRGVLVGGATGAVVGFLIGPLIIVPVEEFASLIAAGLGGSVTLVALGVIVRVTGRRQKDETK